MKMIVIEVVDRDSLHERLFLSSGGLEVCDADNETSAYKTIRKQGRIRMVTLSGQFMHYLARELRISATYRDSFLNFHSGEDGLRCTLRSVDKEVVDYGWNDRLTYLVREKCELEHALSWLSTLGGAFSALGDYYSNCAETAGRISFNQFRLALRLQDPAVMTRCRLYLGLSLVQRGEFRTARRMIRYEYDRAKSACVADERLLKMCKGIWSKLQYEHQIAKSCKTAVKMKINAG